MGDGDTSTGASPATSTGAQGSSSTSSTTGLAESSTSQSSLEGTGSDSTGDGSSETGGSTEDDPGTTRAEGSSSGSTTGGTESSGTTTSEGGDSTSTGLVDTCGDMFVDTDEDCDSSDLNGASCDTLGFASGDLTCAADCTFDTSSCATPTDEMVLVPAGTFEMGSDDAAEEQPIRTVNLDAFFIDTTEVTTEAFTACVTATECAAPGSGGTCNYGNAANADHPINCVSQELAADYCEWVGKTLPTEAQWEKAAHGPTYSMFPWGDTPGPTCENTIMGSGAGLGCGTNATWPVGSRPTGASMYGGLDMAGNVWEWVSDWYAPYDDTDLDNPTGPVAGTQRIVRGGGWFHQNAADFTTTHRHELNPTVADQFIGFRCVLVVEAE